MKILPFNPRREAARSTAQPSAPVYSGGGAYITRQPILDGRRAVCGYELLFRGSLGNPSQASEHVCEQALADAVLAIGLDTLTHGRPAFVNISRSFLLEGIPTLLPPQQVVIELAVDAIGDDETFQACRALKEAGYKIALDNFVFSDGIGAFIPFADYIKIDFRALSDPEVRGETVRRLRDARPRLIAEKIETADQFEQAFGEGFTYFQGYFFGQAVIRQAREIPPRQMACLQLLNALNKPGLSVAELEDIIKHDTMLTYRLLRAVSSAAAALPARAPAVRSVQLALTLLGRDTVRRWASLWAVAALAEPRRGGQAELVTMSILRARCCELLDPPGNDDGFLLGMCSLLDAILGQPLTAVLGLLPLTEDTGRALCGDQNQRRHLLDCVIAYERGEWEECWRLANSVGVDPSMLPIAYREALSWTRGLDGTAA